MNKNKITSNEEVKNSVDLVHNEFVNLLQNLSLFRSQISNLQGQIRNLEKFVKKELKVANKLIEKHQKKKHRNPSGFAKPSSISPQLCNFMQKEEGALVARTEVTQFIIKYINIHSLQNPNNRKIIVPDESLKNLLGVDDSEEVTYFNLQKYMNRHFTKTPIQNEVYSATTDL